MGIHINLAVLLQDWLKRHDVRGPAFIFGARDISFTWEQFDLATSGASSIDQRLGAITAESLFDAFGLGPLIAPGGKGSEYNERGVDLNHAELPQDLRDAAGFVFNGGMLEHVFNVPNAVNNMSRMVRGGGYLMHVMPYNNWSSEGFYQFSPKFIFDYYGAQGLAVVEAALVSFDPKHNPDVWRLRQVAPWFRAQTGGNAFDSSAHVFCALVRVDADVMPATPTNAYYAHKTKAHPTRWFPRYDLSFGTKIEYPNRKIIPLRQMMRREGRMWVAHLPELEFLSDGMEHPQRSPAVLLEDATALGPNHAPHSDISASGSGAYSHWGTELLFSSSDGSDPDHNGHDYTLVIPFPEQT